MSLTWYNHILRKLDIQLPSREMIYHPCFFQNIEFFIRSSVDTLESSCCATCADVTTPAPTTTESQCFDTNDNCDGGLLQLNEANKQRYVCLQLPTNIVVQRIRIVECFRITQILTCVICDVFAPLGQRIIVDNCSYAHMLLALFHSPGELLQCLQYKAVEITFPAVEQLCAVYKVSMLKRLYFRFIYELQHKSKGNDLLLY